MDEFTGKIFVLVLVIGGRKQKKQKEMDQIEHSKTLGNVLIIVRAPWVGSLGHVTPHLCTYYIDST